MSETPHLVSSSAGKRSPRSPYAGIRIRVAGGPREGQLGTIVRRDSGLYFYVEFDDGTRHFVMRHLALTLDGARVLETLRNGRDRSRPAARVAELHAAGHERVVVYRTASGRVWVRPWAEQDIESGLIGVYTPGVDPAQIEEDLA